MLNKMTLSNFGRHEDLTVDFGPGLVAIRSQNEGGKSTLLKGVLYALFGTKALPDSLEDTVTWGKPAAALKVKLTFTVNGEIYEITRGKSGAELVSATATVTGQTETAKAVADLLGVDAAMAANILVAEQGAIRGALTGGSKGATALIEKLADFERLEQLVELLQGALVTGNTSSAKAALEQAQQTLESTTEPAPVDEAALDDAVARAAALMQALRTDVSDLAQKAKEAAQKRDEAFAAQARRSELVGRVQARQQMLDEMCAEIPPAGDWGPDQESRLCDSRARVERAKGDVRARRSYDFVVELARATDVRWGRAGAEENDRYEGTLQQAQAESKGVREEIKAKEREVADLTAMATKSRILIVRDSCSLCGRDVSDIPEVAAKNAKLEQEAKEADAAAAKAAGEASDLQEYSDALAEALLANSELERKLADIPQAALAGGTVPASPIWRVEAPMPPADAEERLERAEATVALIEQEKADAGLARRARAEHEARVKGAEEMLQKLKEELAGLDAAGEAPAEELKAAARAAQETLDEAKTAFGKASEHYHELKADAAAKIKVYRSALQARQQALDTVGREQGRLRDLEFNNELMKAIRAARPVVANRLWSLVLGAVSAYFSEMRGQPCTVTRGDGGFLVDGHPVSTLSGSTKDILGLAIRVALTRTFLPNIGMLLLDEPNAAMDDERTSRVLGFIAGAGFDQTIVVSHDELTVDVADHVVTL